MLAVALWCGAEEVGAEVSRIDLGKCTLPFREGKHNRRLSSGE